MVGDIHRPADGIPVIILLIRCLLASCAFTFGPGFRLEEFIAVVFEGAAVERTATGLRFHFYRAGTVAAVLCPVTGGENFEFRDGFWIWVYVQVGIGAVIHVVSAIELPIVVLAASAINTARDVAVNTYHTVIRAGVRKFLADYAMTHLYNSRDVAAVKLAFAD